LELGIRKVFGAHTHASVATMNWRKTTERPDCQMVAVNNFGASQAAQFREQAITVERNQHNVRTAD